MSALPAASRPGVMRVWWTAVRPRTLTMAMAPVALGAALAFAVSGRLDLVLLLVTLACALLIQIGTNLYNDAIDFERGTDRTERVGPLRVTLAGWASAAQVKRAALLCLLLALVLGAWLSVVGGLLILAIGVASLVASWAYSGGPWPISHSPFGELFVLLFFGILAVMGSHWLQSRTTDFGDVLAGVAVGAPAAAVLLVNNVRDLDSDRRAGRFTLAALLGAQGSQRAYVAFILCSPVAWLLLAIAGLPGAVLGLLGAPTLLRLMQRFRRAQSGEALNAVLVDTARAGSLSALLAAAGISAVALF